LGQRLKGFGCGRIDRAALVQQFRLAEEHVAFGREQIARQYKIIALRDGHDATSAKKLLNTFEAIQETLEADRDRLSKALADLGCVQCHFSGRAADDIARDAVANTIADAAGSLRDVPCAYRNVWPAPLASSFIDLALGSLH
jgi:hypothetical protein